MLKGERFEAGARGRTTRGAAVFILAWAAVALLVQPAIAELPATSTPILTLARTIRTTPFVGTSISTRDAEGTAFVPRDGSLWLIGDNGRAAFEIDPYTGVLKRRLDGSVFDTVAQLGGGPVAGPERSGDLESLAYDESSDTLYAFSGSCCNSAARSTAFRFTRDPGSQELVLDAYQPLPNGTDYTGAAWNSLDDTVYVGKANRLRTYDFTTNTAGPDISVKGISGIFGLDFTSSGQDLMIVTNKQRLFRVNWATRKIVTGWNLDLTPFGVKDSRAVEVIPSQADSSVDQLYVYDGYDDRSSGDPLKYALFVFDVSDGGGPPQGIVGNPGFEVDTAGWKGGSVGTLTRVSPGHDGSYAARLTNDGTTSGTCLLNDSPNWVTSTVSGTYTASAWVRGDVAGAVLRLRFREYNGGTVVGTPVISQIPLTTSWQQVSVSIVPQPGDALDLTAYVQNAPPGTCFYADDISITV